MNSNKLKAKLAENGLSQRKLASMIGMNKNALNNRINGRSEFSLDEVENICVALHITDAVEISSIFLPGCLKFET